MIPSRPPRRDGYWGLLADSRFCALVGAYALGLLNDYILRIVVSLCIIEAAGGARSEGGLLALVGALYVLPFLLFSGLAGRFGDACDKRRVLVRLKQAEIAIMALGALALASGRVDFMLGVLFLMAAQSAFFSPVRQAIIPETLPHDQIARANALCEVAAFVMIIAGTVLGGALFDLWGEHLANVALVQVALAVAGAAASLGIARGGAPLADLRAGWSPWRESLAALARLRAARPLWILVLGISYFWFVGALLQLDLILLGTEDMSLDGVGVGVLQAAVGLGVAAGSLAAGALCARRAHAGLAPLGLAGMAGSAVLVLWAVPDLVPVSLALVLGGFMAGLFVLPLNAALQQRAAPEARGRILAANNLLNMVAAVGACGALWLFHDVLDLGAGAVVLVIGLANTAVAVGAAVAGGRPCRAVRPRAQAAASAVPDFPERPPAPV